MSSDCGQSLYHTWMDKIKQCYIWLWTMFYSDNFYVIWASSPLHFLTLFQFFFFAKNTSHVEHKNWKNSQTGAVAFHLAIISLTVSSECLFYISPLPTCLRWLRNLSFCQNCQWCFLKHWQMLSKNVVVFFKKSRLMVYWKIRFRHPRWEHLFTLKVRFYIFF